MTTDGYEDNKITAEGLKDYKIPPQLNVPSAGAEPESNLSNSQNCDEDHEEALDGDIEHPPNEGLEQEDFEMNSANANLKPCTIMVGSQHCMKSVQILSFFWSVSSRIRIEYGEIFRISPYSARMRENTDQKKLHIWTLFTQCKKYRMK